MTPLAVLLPCPVRICALAIIVRRKRYLTRLAAGAMWVHAIVVASVWLPHLRVSGIGSHEPSVFGFNADTAVYEDLIEAGVIDPTKVTRTALLNAASVSALMLTTECMVSELPKDDKAAPGMGGMPPGGGMY